jgi:hypothetical protein
MKCYFDVGSGQKSKRGEGVLLYPLTQKLLLGCQKLDDPNVSGWVWIGPG